MTVALCVRCGERVPLDTLCTCRKCALTVAETLGAMFRLYNDLLTRPKVGKQSGSRSTADQHPLPTSPEGLEARTAIREVISSWSEAVADERDLRTPPNGVEPRSRFLVVHLRWILASERPDLAAAFCEEIGELAGYGKVAYPARMAGVKVDCPTVLDDATGEVCGSRVWLDGDQQFITCRSCGKGGTPAWWWKQLQPGNEWLHEGPLIEWLFERHGYALLPETLRQWRKRGQVTAKRERGDKRWSYSRTHALLLVRGGGVRGSLSA